MYYQAPDSYISGVGLSSQAAHTAGMNKQSLSQAQMRLIENGSDDITGTDITGGSVSISHATGQNHRNDVTVGGGGAGALEALPLTLKEIFKAMLVLQEDVQAPTFDRIFNAPKQSEMVKGKYVLVCSTEAWASLLWDSNLRTAHGASGANSGTQLAPANMNLLQDGFAGDLFGKITAKFDPFPLRFDHNGDFVVPQKESNGKVVPNPSYTAIGNGGTGDDNDGSTNDAGNASYEIAFLVGADAFKTIQVGPPPKEFASKNMSAKKFYGMKWNGEVNLTDQFLIPTGSGSAPLTDAAGSELNTYGDYLKFISQAIIGGIAGDARYCLPIYFKRQRTS
jgi:hypothetical protein